MGTVPSFRSRWPARLAVIAVLGVVVSAAVRDRDSFPLSTYPMYATVRTDVATLSTAVGVDAGGDVHRLSLGTIARTDDPLITESLVDQAITADGGVALCAEIAGRVAAASFDAIEVVEERHDIVDRAAGRESLLDRTVHARCEVRS